MNIAKIAICQINSCVGDIDGNFNKIFNNVKKSKENKANIVITPELSLLGYPPYDLLLRDDFITYQNKKLIELTDKLSIFSNIYVLVGHASSYKGHLYNSVSILCNGRIIGTYHKNNLPNYSIFNEKRYFTSNFNKSLVFNVNNIPFGILICEDLWQNSASIQTAKDGAKILLVLNASPYSLNKIKERDKVIDKCIDDTSCSVIYVNSIGGQDDLVFDGSSIAIDKDKKCIFRCPSFEESLSFIEVNDDGNFLNIKKNEINSAYNSKSSDYNTYNNLWNALLLSLKDYIYKNNIQNVVIGLSGGIDSALVLALAFDALGKEKITTVMMPYKYTSKISIKDAFDMANNLEVQHFNIPINSIVNSMKKSLKNIFFNDFKENNVEQNIQARIRGHVIMALSNKIRAIVLNTSNKSELATGYCTLYGDMVGGFSILKDISKTMVYKLANYRNSISNIIPKNIVEREPSAELKYNQLDTDDLPSYNVLDRIIELFVEENKSAEQIIDIGYNSQEVKKIINLIQLNEYKRSQSILGPIVSKRSFCRDRVFPITNKFQFCNH